MKPITQLQRVLLSLPLVSVPVIAEELPPETLSELTGQYLRGEFTSRQPIWNLELRDCYLRDRNWKGLERISTKAINQNNNGAAPAFHQASQIENYGADTSSAPGEHSPLISLDREETLLKIIDDQNALIEALSTKVKDLEKKLNERH